MSRLNHANRKACSTVVASYDAGNSYVKPSRGLGSRTSEMEVTVEVVLYCSRKRLPGLGLNLHHGILTAFSPQELEVRVPEGQHLFENLLHLGLARGTSSELEDVRYQWMLYKSKLKDSGYLLVGA